MGLRYRTLQFLRTLREKPTGSDLQFAHKHLPESLRPLFDRMSPSDQVHSIRVCQTIIAKGSTDDDLLVAALLHDVGKSVITPMIWERVLVVLANRIMPGKVLKWGEAKPEGWKRAFVIAHKHPDWGADLVAQHGGTPATEYLIRNHQQAVGNLPELELSDQLMLLQAADCGN